MSIFSPLVLHQPASISEAVALLAAGGRDCAPLAGGTWIMRAPIRHEAPPPVFVSLSKISALSAIAISEERVELGAAVTHAALAEAVAGYPDLQVLAEAAGRSANPAIRATATIGGNLCTTSFPAADLLPALLSLDAEVDLARSQGRERLSLEVFLERRAALVPGWLLTRVVVPREAGRSAHARLPLRKAGDYPVAIVSVAIRLCERDRVTKACVAIGAVETVARRWRSLEAVLLGEPVDPERAGAAAERLLYEITGREGIEAPGWYRVHVLPSLVRRAMAGIAESLSSGNSRPCRSP
ncbi:FAD binding domain-containing protein [Lichenifustis flavocetrariae]|uniref:FAD binding domain-containing protein n=1 Tax=Lichenifustis flavocetrariae TaxID=2949735 RepID=A0AA41YYR6_9HYPH|nr:FAD binding domain-containing protein [Lichenifustis flavocetrariae]MCW6509682.1 FAD binding domain-containing protein [Lichenifustis flavocetrariae]